MSNIQIDMSQVNKVMAGLKGFEKQIPGATVSAINRTLNHVNTQLGRMITSEYTIKVSDVKSTITKNKASRSNLQASLLSRGRPLTLTRFRFTPSSPPPDAVRFGAGGGHSGKSYPVKVKVKKGSALKRIQTSPDVFVQSLNGRVQIMKRIGNKRLPVEVLRSLSVPQMIDSGDISDRIKEEANSMLAKRVEHEIAYRLEKVKAK